MTAVYIKSKTLNESATKHACALNFIIRHFGEPTATSIVQASYMKDMNDSDKHAIKKFKKVARVPVDRQYIVSAIILQGTGWLAIQMSSTRIINDTIVIDKCDHHLLCILDQSPTLAVQLKLMLSS